MNKKLKWPKEIKIFTKGITSEPIKLIKIKDLKKILGDVPDEYTIFVSTGNGSGQIHELYLDNDKKEVRLLSYN